jgi:hypothetical protein
MADLWKKLLPKTSFSMTLLFLLSAQKDIQIGSNMQEF